MTYMKVTTDSEEEIIIPSGRKAEVVFGDIEERDHMEALTKLVLKARSICRRFVEKVEGRAKDGRTARSTETYNQCKDFLTLVEHYKEE